MNLGHFIQRAGLALVAGIVLFSPQSAAAVRFEVVAGNVDGGTVEVSVVLRSEGSGVGGGQNDLLYDTSIIDLERTSSCRINPDIGDRLPNCEEDPSRITEPCKTLSRNRVRCGDTPGAPGCEGQSPATGRFRGIIAATAVPNNNVIPDGSVLYTCEFTVVDAGRLPTTIINTNIVASDPFGTRLPADGTDAIVRGSGSSNPTPTATPTGARLVVRDAVASGGTARVDVVALGDGIGGAQIDLLFDTRIVDLARTSSCSINPDIGDRLDDCEEDPEFITAPCKTLSRNLVRCGDAPDAPGCDGQPAHVGRFRGIVAATAVPNNNVIPSGTVLFSCDFQTVDERNLPTTVGATNVVASDPFGIRIEASGQAGRIVTELEVTPTPRSTPPVSPTPRATPTRSEADVSIEARDAEASGGRAVVEIVLFGNGVGGAQTDLLFDTRAIALARASACSINPAIGDRLENCEEDPELITEPCKTLSRNLVSCGTTPDAPGCEGQPSFVGRLRAIVAATAVPNNNPIPNGSVLIRCDFDVVAANRLPAEITLANLVTSDPFGARIDVRNGGSATIRADGGSTFTPTPTSVRPGGQCNETSDCVPGFFCNEREGLLCCNRLECAPNETCRHPNNPGFCTLLPTPTPTRLPSGERCSPNAPEACASGNCVHNTCCQQPFCVNDERCDIIGFAGRCVPPLSAGAPCAKNSDCEGDLQCLDLDGTGPRCGVRPITPTRIPTPIPTATPQATIIVDPTATPPPTPDPALAALLRDQCLLVADADELTLNVVNDRVVRTILLPSCATDLCWVSRVLFGRDASTAFAAVNVEGGESYIAVVDVARGFVTRTIAVGTELTADLVPSPDGRRVYVSLGDAGAIAVIDVDRGEVVDRIGIGGELGAVGLTADGESLFVAVNSGPRIAVISTEMRRVVDGFALEPLGDLETRWIGIGLAPDGSRVLAITVDGFGDDAHVQLIDTRSRVITPPRSDRRLDGIVQISADGESAYVGSFGEGAVFVLSMRTGQLLVEIPIDEDTSVFDLGIGDDGGLVFAGLVCFGCDDGVVAVIDGNTNIVRGRLAVGLEPGAFGVASAPCGAVAPPTPSPTRTPLPTATPCMTNCGNPGGGGGGGGGGCAAVASAAPGPFALPLLLLVGVALGLARRRWR